MPEQNANMMRCEATARVVQATGQIHRHVGYRQDEEYDVSQAELLREETIANETTLLLMNRISGTLYCVFLRFVL